MADFNKPVSTDTYANVLSLLNAKASDLALGLDPATSTPTNLPTNSLRWNSASNKWQKWNGSAWNDMSSLYAINISGNAATATLAAGLSGFTNSASANPIAGPDAATQNGIGYVNGLSSLLGQSDGALHTQAYNATYVHQIFGDYRTGQMAVRGKNNGTWTAWRVMLDSGNYNSYAPTLTGGGASGTWPISISGSAPWANVTGKPGQIVAAAGNVGGTSDWNGYTGAGVYLVGNSNWGSSPNSPSAAYNWGSLLVTSDGANATSQLYMPHQGGLVYRSKWNASDWQGWRYILDSANVGSYAVPLTGSTASAAVPAGTTAQRDASPAAGYLRYNTTLAQFEGYSGGAWTAFGGGLKSGTEQNAAQGNFNYFVDFTGIPAGVKRVTVALNGVSTNGSWPLQLQIGSSAGIEQTGYASQANTFNNSPGGVGITTGFSLMSTNNPSYSWSGIVQLLNVGGNTWVTSGTIMTNADGAASLFAGNKTISGTLDRLRLVVDPSNYFDAGTINIFYE